MTCNRYSNTKGFPQGINIPTMSDICPGCAQGKMPAASHPHSDTRASKAFVQIHSDLKSFPILSYHKYKYFIVFLDDYMSQQYNFIFSFMPTFFFLVYFTLSHVTLLSHGSHV